VISLFTNSLSSLEGTMTSIPLFLIGLER